MKWVSLVLALVCLGLFVGLSVVPDIRGEILASQRSAKWAGYWAGKPDGPELDFDTDLLPTQIPGPADGWAGGKPHQVGLRINAQPGQYRLEIQSFDAHETAAPRLEFKLNGRPVHRVQMGTGRGWPAPYHKVRRYLTVSVPLEITEKGNLLEIVNIGGSWLAPAKVRLSQGSSLNPAKGAYLLLIHQGYFLLLALVLILALFFWVAGRSGLKNAGFAVVLVIISTGLGLLLMEIGFREYLIRFPQARHLAAREARNKAVEKGQRLSLIQIIEPSPAPEILYTLKPNLDGFFLKHPLKTNSHGMRSAEVTREKRPGVIRVVGLGDSNMFGWGLARQDTIGEQLGVLLAREYKQPVEILNFACPSYNTAMEVSVYEERARPFKPDLAMLVMVNNDLSMPSLRLQLVERFTLEKSYIREQLRRWVAVYWEDSVYERDGLFVRRHHLGRMTKEEQKQMDRWGKELDRHVRGMTGKRAVAAFLKQWSVLLQEDGIKGVFVYDHHTLGKLTEDAAFVLKAAEQYGLQPINMIPIYAQYLRRHGYRRMRDVLWVERNDSHPNRVRAGLIAQAIFDRIVNKGLLDRRLQD